MIAKRKDMPMENMVRLYDVFEEAIEYSLDTLSELYLSVIKKENGVAMMLWLCSSRSSRVDSNRLLSSTISDIFSCHRT